MSGTYRNIQVNSPDGANEALELVPERIQWQLTAHNVLILMRDAAFIRMRCNLPLGIIKAVKK